MTSLAPGLTRPDLSDEALAAVTSAVAATAEQYDRSGAVPTAGIGVAHRAGLLTAVATEGFDALAATLDSAGRRRSGRNRLAALGRAYIDFGLTHPALFDLMFRPSEIHPDDAALQDAQARAIGALVSSVARLVEEQGSAPDEVTDLTLISWALVHGLVVLGRDGVLKSAADLTGPDAVPKTAHHLAALFTRRAFRD